MDLGIFMEFEIRRGGDQMAAFREGFEVVDAAEVMPAFKKPHSPTGRGNRGGAAAGAQYHAERGGPR